MIYSLRDLRKAEGTMLLMKASIFVSGSLEGDNAYETGFELKNSDLQQDFKPTSIIIIL